jgi:competence protein ComEC
MSARIWMGRGWLELRRQLWRISCRSPMLWIALAGASGIIADHCFSGTTGFWLAALILALVSSFIVGIGRRWCAIPLVIVPLFALQHAFQREQYDSATLPNLLGSNSQPVIVEATIDRPPVLQPHPMAGYALRRDLSPWQTEFECRVDRIQIAGKFEPVSGRLLAVVDGDCENHRPGDQVRLYGTIQTPSPPTNPGERDMRDSYRQRDLHARMSLSGDDQIEVISEASGSLLSWVAGLARQSRESLLKHTADSTGGLAVALVIGQTDFVDPATRDLLLITGTAHALSVSGLHLAIVVMLARWVGIMLRLSQPIQLVHIVAVSVFYSLITGGRPPVLRASILVGMVVLSTMMRRPSMPINTLSFAAVILLAWKPSLLFNVGVQLSFLAVATLMLCGRSGADGWFSIQQVSEHEERLRELANSSSPVWVRGSRWLGAWLRQAFWYSSCVTVIGLPLVWHQFHIISPVSVIANVLMSVPLTIALASGIATALTAIVSETLAGVPGFICDQSLVLMLGTIRFLAAWSFGHAWLPSPPAWLVIVFYVVIAMSLLAPRVPAVRVGRFGPRADE